MAKTVLIGLTSGLLYLLDPIGAYAQRHTKAIMMVFYITDRQETSGTLSGPIFSGEPSSPPQLSYGVGTVPVVWNRWDVFRNLWSDVMLSSENTSFDLESLAPEHFYGEVSTSIQAAHNHDGLLFVHGFHNSFEDAIRTAAKLSLDLKFPGVTILYSWPSKGEFAAYDHDSDKAQVSIEHLTPVLVRLAFLPLQQATPRFHVIAHSMGTLVLSKAIEESKLNKQPFSNVILAAADIDEDIFPQVASALTSSSSRVTLYVSKWDAALELSNKLHQGTRVGRTVVCRNGMDVIDAQNADKSLLGLYHGYVFDSDLVLDDLFALAWHGDIPQERAHVHQSDDHCTWNLQPR
jgi:esterase/lipase superfamily enzyme